MSVKLNIASNQYYGITSFNSIASKNQKTSSSMNAIYGAGSQLSQMNALTSAIGSLRSAASAAPDNKTREAIQTKIGNITASMETSFKLADSSLSYKAPETRSIRQMAKDEADEMVKKYKAGTKIDELI